MTDFQGLTPRAEQTETPVASAVPTNGLLIPQNCSLGTRQFCIGFRDYQNCNDLPLNVSAIFSKAFTGLINDQNEDLQFLGRILAKATPALIREPLIAGLALALLLAISVIFTIAGPQFDMITRWIGPALSSKLRLATSLACCLLFFIPTVVCLTLLSEAQSLTTTFGVKKGDVSNNLFAIFLFSTIMMTLVAVIQIFIKNLGTGS